MSKPIPLLQHPSTSFNRPMSPILNGDGDHIPAVQGFTMFHHHHTTNDSWLYLDCMTARVELTSQGRLHLWPEESSIGSPTILMVI